MMQIASWRLEGFVCLLQIVTIFLSGLLFHDVLPEQICQPSTHTLYDLCFSSCEGSLTFEPFDIDLVFYLHSVPSALPRRGEEKWTGEING